MTPTHGHTPAASDDAPQQQPSDGPDPAAAIAYLQVLVAPLQLNGFTVTEHPTPASGRPFLEVVHGETTRGGEVVAECSAPGIELGPDLELADIWAYWWAWDEPIGPVTEPQRAIRTITEALGPAAGESTIRPSNNPGLP
jgi:hypothetical protein